MKSIVVTGASTGIGWGISKIFIEKGWRVFGSVRKQADAVRLQTEFGQNFTPLLFDVTDDEGVKKGFELVKSQLNGEALSGLVNNAGIAVSGPMIHVDLEELKWQFEVNVIGAVRVTQAFAPLLGAIEGFKGSAGKIINISSVAGEIAGPFLGSYAGSKFALEGISHSMRRELQKYGVQVVIVRPGFVSTPIWDKESATDQNKWEGNPYADAMIGYQKYMLKNGKRGLKPEDLGNKVWQIMDSKKPKLIYPVVKNYLKEWLIPSSMPVRWLDNYIKKGFGW